MKNDIYIKLVLTIIAIELFTLNFKKENSNLDLVNSAFAKNNSNVLPVNYALNNQASDTLKVIIVGVEKYVYFPLVSAGDGYQIPVKIASTTAPLPVNINFPTGNILNPQFLPTVRTTH